MWKSRNHSTSVPSLWELSSYKTVSLHEMNPFCSDRTNNARVTGAAQKSLKQVLGDLLLHCTPLPVPQGHLKHDPSKKGRFTKTHSPKQFPGVLPTTFSPERRSYRNGGTVTATIHRQRSRTPQCARALLPLNTPCRPPRGENTVSLRVTCVTSLFSLFLLLFPPSFRRKNIIFFFLKKTVLTV